VLRDSERVGGERYRIYDCVPEDALDNEPWANRSFWIRRDHSALTSLVRELSCAEVEARAALRYDAYPMRGPPGLHIRVVDQEE
jgi:hypothetical protein